jgi:hypothetical protein
MCDGDKNVYPRVSKKLASTNCKKIHHQQTDKSPKEKAIQS